MIAAVATIARGPEVRRRREQMTEDRNASGRELYEDLVEKTTRAEEDAASVNPGDLAVLYNGSNAMKAALDQGDALAVKTMARLDPLTLTEPCYQPTGGSALTPLAYLRRNLRRRRSTRREEEEEEAGNGRGDEREGGETGGREQEGNRDGNGEGKAQHHPYAQDMVPLLEGLLLQHGFVPLADGIAIPVQLLVTALQVPRPPELTLQEWVREGSINLKQFKALLNLQRLLPQNAERTDPSLSFLVKCAEARISPDNEYNHNTDRDYDDDDGDDGRLCVVS